MSRTYCYHCAKKLQPKSERSWWCEVCQQTYFENVASGAEALIVNDKNELLVVERAIDPYKGKLDFPGGFVNFNETHETALWRELMEEIELQKTDVSEPTYVGSYYALYPWGKDVTHVVVAVYMMRLQKQAVVAVSDEVSAVKFIPFDKLVPEDFAEFNQHQAIVDKVRKIINNE